MICGDLGLKPLSIFVVFFAAAVSRALSNLLLQIFRRPSGVTFLLGQTLSSLTTEV